MKRRDLLVTIVGLVIVWQLASMLLNAAILPAPLRVLTALVEELNNELVAHFTASLWRVLAGMLLAVFVAVPVGLLLGSSESMGKLFSPLLYLLYPIPKVIFVPIILLLFGIGDLAKIITIFTILFFQIVVLVRDAAAGIAPQLLQSLRSLGAGRRATFRFAHLPASLPAIFTALRQSIGTAVAVLYITELIATRYGLGYYIYYNGSTLLNYPAMYAGVIAMSLLGLGLYFGVDFLERRFCKWRFVD